MKFLIIRIWENAFLRLSRMFWTLVSRFSLWMHGCRAGVGFRVDGRLIIQCREPNVIEIGEGVTINSRFMSNLVGMTNPSVLCCYGDGKIVIGDHTGISGAILSSKSRIQVGDHVTVGGNVRIFDHDFHSLDPEHRRVAKLDRENCRTAPVTIGDDVFIGTNSIILKGVTIGARCIVGAGSVVSLKEIPADSIVAGNPARIISTKTPS
ncbi:MAG: acyltransferase [Opitutaceae bacterium]